MLDLNILLRLLFAHIIMDFLLQSSKMVKAKTEGTLKERITSNLIHSGLHALAAYVVVMQWGNWILPLVILISHFLIDFFLKSRTKRRDSIHEKKGMRLFILDQMLHLAVIVCLWLTITNQFAEVKDWFVSLIDRNTIWKYLIAYMLVLSPVSIVIKMFIKKWEEEVNKKKNQQQINVEEQGLNQAGQWIGYMERVLVLTFVVLGYWEAIGFLLAAKSIFRYGDLKENKDIRMTEYVLIGTLASFSWAIIIGLIINQI